MIKDNDRWLFLLRSTINSASAWEADDIRRVITILSEMPFPDAVFKPYIFSFITAHSCEHPSSRMNSSWNNSWWMFPHSPPSMLSVDAEFHRVQVVLTSTHEEAATWTLFCSESDESRCTDESPSAATWKVLTCCCAAINSSWKE